MTRILVIDDNASICDIISKMLTQDGYCVDQAANGAEALELMRQNRPDLIITDLLMPKKDGLSVIMDVRKIDAKTPIIAISGTRSIDLDSILNVASEIGADRIVKKPFKAEVILQMIRELLGK